MGSINNNNGRQSKAKSRSQDRRFMIFHVVVDLLENEGTIGLVESRAGYLYSMPAPAMCSWSRR